MTVAVSEHCAKCGCEIEECWFCEEPRCGVATCSKCIGIDLHERRPEPYVIDE